MSFRFSTGRYALTSGLEPFGSSSFAGALRCTPPIGKSWRGHGHDLTRQSPKMMNKQKQNIYCTVLKFDQATNCIAATHILQALFETQQSVQHTQELGKWSSPKSKHVAESLGDMVFLRSDISVFHGHLGCNKVTHWPAKTSCFNALTPKHWQVGWTIDEASSKRSSQSLYHNRILLEKLNVFPNVFGAFK